MDIQTSIETITPEIAAQYLLHNIRNRPVRERLIKKYIDIIARDEWMLNGESIKFDENGNLLDGQHRLMALSRSDRSIKSVVIRNLSAESFNTLDTGTLRVASDTIALSGYKYSKILATAVTLLYFYQNKGIYTSYCLRARLTSKQIMDFLDQHKDIEQSCIHVVALRRGRSLISPALATFCYHIFSEIDYERANTFFIALYNGFNLNEGNPIVTLRNKLLDNRLNPAHLRSHYLIAFMFKAWNAYMEGRQLKILKWNNNEEFPVLNSTK